ncbi:hypothetical protein ACHQM5_007504 [Ranunculus cassubicifolius]
MRRPCFVEDDVGLASIATTDDGLTSTPKGNNSINPFFTRPRKSTSYRSLSSLSSSSSSNSNSSNNSPRSTRFYESRCKEPQLPHFLEACYLCKKPLSDNRDIFMYRGDTPFCSEDCREEQIEIDEANEKNLKFAASMNSIRREKQSKSTSNKARNYQVRTSTVAAA